MPAADPGGDLNRAADDGAAQPAAAGEEPHPAPLWRPVGRKRENRPGRADQRPAQGADQPAQHRLPVPAHRRAGVHHAAAAAAHPPAHPGAHRRRGPDHPGGQRPHPSRGHPARDAARLPRRPRRAGDPPEPAHAPDHRLPRVMTRQKGSSPATVVAGGRHVTYSVTDLPASAGSCCCRRTDRSWRSSP